MRLKDLKFDTHYATCDGHRVTLTKFEGEEAPVIRRRYVAYPLANEAGEIFTDPSVEPTNTYLYKSEERTFVFLPENSVPVVSEDPWGKCQTQRARSIAAERNRSHVFVDGKWCMLQMDQIKGITVDVHRVGPDGEVIGGGYRTAYAAKDIPGTWLEYMSLHAEDVRERGERDEHERLAAKMRQDAADKIAALKKVPGAVNSNLDIRYEGAHWESREADTYTMTIRLTGEEALRYAIDHLDIIELAGATVTEKGNIRLP